MYHDSGENKMKRAIVILLHLFEYLFMISREDSNTGSEVIQLRWRFFKL